MVEAQPGVAGILQIEQCITVHRASLAPARRISPELALSASVSRAV